MKNKSKIFFIITIICIIMTVILIGISIYYEHNIFDKALYDTIDTDLDFQEKRISRTEYNKEYNKFDSIDRTFHILHYSPFIVGGISILFLTTGVVFKIKEKGDIKNVKQ